MDHRRSLRILPAALAACLLCACATQQPLHYDQSFDMPEMPTPPANGAIFHAGYDTGLFENPTAHNVGDIVTILLQESTTAQKSSQTDTAKATKDSLSAPSLLGIPMSIHGHSFLSGSINNSNSFSGERQREVSAQQRLVSGAPGALQYGHDIAPQKGNQGLLKKRDRRPG